MPNNHSRPEREPRVDSPEYLAKREYYSRFLTIYGRSAVTEALETPGLKVSRLHVAGNIEKGELAKIVALARDNGAEINHTTPEKVSRISKNGRQDQGVAADIRIEGYQKVADFLQGRAGRPFRLLALDGVTTPRNVGMVIRSCAAGGLDGVITPEKGCCGINPLVIKASAGTIFKTGILRCDTAVKGLRVAKDAGAEICILAGDGTCSLFDYQEPERVVYVLGSEGEGVSREVSELATVRLRIPMAAGIESLNVAMAATLVAYKSCLSGGA